MFDTLFSYYILLLLAIFVGHTLLFLFKDNLGVWFEYSIILQVDISSIDSLHAGMLQ